MRLGQRSARVGVVRGGELTRPILWLVVAWSIVPAAEAQRATHATVGPGRIFCNAAFCELGIGARPRERIRIIVSGLPEDEVRRLRKCTGVAKPCIVSVDGVEQGDPMKITASSIHWQEPLGQEPLGQEPLGQERSGQE